jgi:hypothetical protein
LVTVGLQRRDISRKLFDLSIEVSHLSSELVHMNFKNIVSASAIDEDAHCISREVRYAARAGG